VIVPIYATSPNGRKAKIGWLDQLNDIATFEITEGRYFQDADACGIDEDVFKRDNIGRCKQYAFRMMFGELIGKVFRVNKQYFMDECFIYPPGNNKEYKANRSVFKPKLMIQMDKLKKIKEESEKPLSADEKLEQEAKRGLFG